MKTINDLEIDEIAKENDEYAYVKKCVHGNKYYGYIGYVEDLGFDINSDDAIEVSDLDIDTVSHCCG